MGRTAKRRKVRVPRGVGSKNMIFPIKRTMQRLPQIVSGVGNEGGAMMFLLSDLPVASEFINLFDQYRIVSVDVHCIPRVNANLSTSPGSISIFHYAKDYTDVTAPTSLDTILQYGDAKRVNVNGVKDFHIKLKPQCANTVWSGLTASGYGAAMEGSWINTASKDVQHYGIKYFWQNNYTTATNIDAYITYSLEFKQAI